jgi:hypothetical protein
VLTPILVVLVGLTVLTHLPLILVGLVVWFLVSRSRHGGPHGYAGHRQQHLR